MRSLLTITFSFFLLAAQAQLFDLGLKGGVNQDDLRSSFQHEPLLGGHAGIFARVKPPVLPGVQGELLVSTLGTNVRAEGQELDLRTASLQAPLFIVMAFGPFELHAGGYYEKYLTKSFTTDSDITFDGNTVRVADLADNGLGLLGGAGLRLGHFYAGARYLYGLEDVGTGPVLDGVRSRQVQAYIGFGFFKPLK
ncbi:MAG: outer membrane beta-barrel protein [Flavobacteriales bacterium]|nr:outer membrane beta-barrel protein [Flavobacteriales bacterium]